MLVAQAGLALHAHVHLGLLGWLLPVLVWLRLSTPPSARRALPSPAALSWPAGEAVAAVLLPAGAVALAAALGGALGSVLRRPARPPAA